MDEWTCGHFHTPLQQLLNRDSNTWGMVAI